MLQLNPDVLTAGSELHLAEKQDQINRIRPFLEKVQRAKQLWGNKISTSAGKNTFVEIKQKLTAAAVSEVICNYCENNEATDIEHIYPKSCFPERTFIYHNYLLACKICNTTYKADNFEVFNPLNPDEGIPLVRGCKPISTDGAFINPRDEDPMNLLVLDILGGSLLFSIHPNAKPHEKTKANCTLRILGLNERDALIKARKDGNRIYYCANQDHPLYSDLLSIVEKTVGIVSVLRKRLEDSRITCAFIFGSIAKNTEKAKSDIDLLIIGSIGMREVSKLLSGLQENLGREINPHVYTLDGFKKKLAAKDHFLTSVLQQKIKPILGDVNEYR
jgi:uncharacterized protein (TIGR02646 family)